MIYGDFDPKQFAVDANLNVKLVDIDSREVISEKKINHGVIDSN